MLCNLNYLLGYVVNNVKFKWCKIIKILYVLYCKYQKMNFPLTLTTISSVVN